MNTTKTENIGQKITGYHYTNLEAYISMHTKGIDGYYTPYFDNFSGLIPHGRFIKFFARQGLPKEAYESVIEGALEPEPKSWIENPEFPRYWGYLMHDICREKHIVLLSFELKPEDKAYVVDRAHVERELYRKHKGQGDSTKKTMSDAYRKYWESRIPVFEYKGGYDIPQLAIWSGIEFERLKVEWIKPHDEVWKRVLENEWY
ncbi:MAG: hypothetical protein ACP5NW_02700 [Candidatus Woesearchaeota archaeon]